MLKLNVALAAEAVPDELALEAGVGWDGEGGGGGRYIHLLSLSAKTFCRLGASKTFILQFVQGKRHSPKSCWTL